MNPQTSSVLRVSTGCAAIAVAIQMMGAVDAHADFLNDFSLNPKKAMNQKLKRRATGNTEAAVKKNVEPWAKDQARAQMCTTQGNATVCLKDVLPGRAPIAEDDMVEGFLEMRPDEIVDTLEEMERQRLVKKSLVGDENQPWSDYYWPIAAGITANRYEDSAFSAAASENWGKAYDFFKANPVTNSSSVETLSPAEKYDLLVGDTSMTLTKRQWAEGKQYWDEYGKVESWMGVCHGWAPAAYMLPRATNAVTVTAADGKTQIKFFPSDIKALATLLWANTQQETTFIGGRCDVKETEQDENGRVKEQQCFDSNPGTWHKAVVNQIGVLNRSFVMDATFDYEVWNQPVSGYDYKYFNPQTMKPSTTLAGAKVPVAQFTKDKFKKYRTNREVTHIVGVQMTVEYVVETHPSHATTDGVDNDARTTVEYTYDLELNSRGEIVGGEWYTNAHPDFLWTPVSRAKAISGGDRYATGNWDGEIAVPATWKSVAARTSRYGQPLAKIVDTLIAVSRAGL